MRSSAAFRRLHRYHRPAIVVLVLLVLAGVLWTSGAGRQGDGGSVAASKPAPGMETYSLENGGHKYSLRFYEDARPVVLEDELQGIAVPRRAIASVRPTDARAMTSCSDAGAGWELAGKAEVSGAEVMVCMLGQKGYAAVYDDGSLRHVITVTYLQKQNGAILKDVRQIMGSLSVTAPGETELNDSPV